MELELRHLESEVRFSESEHKFNGYAARFFDPTDPRGTTFRLSERLLERIEPTAFERSLRDGRDILALYNHSSDRTLGRTGAGSLKLWTDNRGLAFELKYDGNDADHRLVKAKCMSRAIAGCSFGFMVGKGGDRFFHEGASDIRALTDVDLYEITLTPSPAYRATNAQFRSADPHEPDVIERWQAWHETEKRLQILKGITI